MSWSTMLHKALEWKYIEALLRACEERVGVARASNYQGIQDHIATPRQLQALRVAGWGGAPSNDPENTTTPLEHVEHALTNLISPNGNYAGGTYYAVNYNDSGGNWDGSADRPKLWTWADLLADIGDPERYLLGQFQVPLAAWIKQCYEVLNRLKWFATPTPAISGSWYVYDSGSLPARKRSTTGYTDRANTEAQYAIDPDVTFGGDAYELPRAYTKDNGTSWVIERCGNRCLLEDFYSRDYGLDQEVDVYCLIEGYDEFDNHGSSWTEGVYNRAITGEVVLSTDFIADPPNNYGYFDLPLVGDTTPTPTSWISSGAGTRGWKASNPTILRKFDGVNGFRFLA